MRSLQLFLLKESRVPCCDLPFLVLIVNGLRGEKENREKTRQQSSCSPDLYLPKDTGTLDLRACQDRFEGCPFVQNSDARVFGDWVSAKEIGEGTRAKYS